MHRTSSFFVAVQYFVNTYRKSVPQKSKAVPITNAFFNKEAKKKDLTIYSEMLGKSAREQDQKFYHVVRIGVGFFPYQLL